MAFAIALILAGCGPTADQSDPLIGTWVGTSPRQPGEVTSTFVEDGSFDWSMGGIDGAWSSDGAKLTLNFLSGSPFCANGNLVWDYQIEGDTLTADVVGGDRGQDVIELGPPSPDWTFERQAGSKHGRSTATGHTRPPSPPT